jgi:hypothetical protein
MATASQGSTVSFAGQSIGSLLSIRGKGASAGVFNCTTAASAIVGTGTNSRIRKQVTVTSIDPGSVTVSILGATPYSRDDVGKTGTLSVSFGSATLSGEAYLESYEIDAQVGDLLKGSATFQFTGS